MTQVIPLTREMVAIVDDEDFAAVSAFKWHAAAHGNGIFSARRTASGKTVYLHRFLMGEIPSGFVVDHINGNPLDCRRANLRIATFRENAMNRRKRSDAKSAFKGVKWRAKKRAWVAKIKVNGRMIFLGNHRSAVDAARAYDKAAREHFGEFARCNFHEQS